MLQSYNYFIFREILMIVSHIIESRSLFEYSYLFFKKLYDSISFFSGEFMTIVLCIAFQADKIDALFKLQLTIGLLSSRWEIRRPDKLSCKLKWRISFPGYFSLTVN
jgi:hypothetical protein